MQAYERIDITKNEVLSVAQRMREAGRMLVLIHGYLDKEGQPVVAYEYDVDGKVESYNVVGEKVLPSISGIYDAAATWPEKELEEFMGMTFQGLDMDQRLFLPEDMLDERGQILVTPLAELRAEREKKMQEN